MHRIMVLIAACTLLLAGCGGDDRTEPTDAGQADQATEAAAAATIEVTSSDLGDILVDAEGRTLYMFVPDQESGEPTCYDECAEAWPAFQASGELTAGEGIDGSLLAAVEREDGRSQVVYNDLPLYYFSGDEEAGETNGQGLNDVWWVVGPEGEPVRE